jgi:tRNA(Ile)-lysidine synthase
MVMFHLLRIAGFRIAVAHCNFQLRGEESQGDAELVMEACRRWNVPFFAKKFDTTACATANGISIQMAARDLRYTWFEELLQSEKCDYVATAHHFDDVVESIFLNLIRGTGIDGFRGIAPKKDKIIRPLLFATRQMIAAYAEQEKITWREDRSNASDDYQRNFLRRQIIPRFLELNPAFAEGFRDTHERLLGARELMLALVDNFRRSAVAVRDKVMYVDIMKLRQSPSPAVLLWELIKDLGFKYDQCRKIAEDHQPGKFFHSSTHQLLADRTHYIIERKQTSEFLTHTLQKGQQWVGEPPCLLSAREVLHTGFHLEKSSSLAQLDADRLKFPLVWRRWQAGDYFVPLGMQQEKKLSDFLIDLKVPFNSKADITVLESGKDIVWVVGFRISERYKVTADTKRILVVEQKQDQE